jgi:hypothetical protein
MLASPSTASASNIERAVSSQGLRSQLATQVTLFQ